MASKKERKQVLEELGLSKEEMKEIWKELVKLHRTFATFDYHEHNWKELSANALRQLPDYLNNIKKNPASFATNEVAIRYNMNSEDYDIRVENETNPVTQEKTEEQKETEPLDWDHEILAKIDAGEELDRDELRELALDGYEVDETKGDNRRWSRTVETIVELCGRYFCIEWEEGLTENQENEFWKQPYEVEKQEYEKTITVTEWKRISEKEKEAAESANDFSQYMNPPEEPDEEVER